MNIAVFLDELAEKGIELWPDGEQLRYRAKESRLTAEIFAQLKAYKADLLAYLNESEPYPLSEGQRGLWFDSNLSREGSEYNLSTVVRIGSLVDLDALRTAFQYLVNRHPALRSTFSQEDGEPVQHVHRYQAVSFTQVDVASRLLPHASVGGGDFRDEETLQAEVMKEHQRLFSLEQGPLFRVHLFTRSPDEHLLLLSWHHLVIDGTSVKVIINELPTLYQAARQKTLPELPPVQSTSAEYVAWQQRQLLSGEIQRVGAYWHEQLAGELPLLNLPTDFPHPPVRTQPAARHVIQLPPPLAQGLRRLARQSGVTLYSLLLAAYQVFLHRYTGQEDLLVGSVTAGRNRPEFAEIVGYFALPVAIRATVTGETPFRDFLQQTHLTVLDVLAHQDYPFTLLVEKLQPERIVGRALIFQAYFALQKMKNGSNTLGRDATFEQMQLVQNWNGLRLSKFVTFQDQTQFDLFLELSDVPNGLEGVFKYSPELFSPATIERMTGQFETLLLGIVAEPTQLIAKLPLLTERERHQILVEWTDTTTDYRKELCVHQLFESQVERTPDAIAVVFKDEQLTYRELNSRANQLAHVLIAKGVAPDVLVAICLPRSIEMVVGLLGILKAGGAYVPLDPTIPFERQRFMLSDSKVQVLLTSGQLVDALGASFSDIGSQEKTVLCLDQDWKLIQQEDDSNPQTIVKPNHLAYCIYTSGSTGQPKGVLIEHRSLLNFVLTAQIEYELSQQDCVLQFSSISFDTSAEEIYPTLLTGATLVLRTDEMLSVPVLWESCRDFELTVLDLPTAYWHQLVSELATTTPLPKGVRLVIIGGERAVPERLKIWQQYVGQRPQLLNTYGPTEGTIVATSYNLSNYRAIFGRELPIGRPLSNVQVYILNQFLQPMPIGVPGELHIGGAGLARGYLNSPQLTFDAFIPNPFGPGRLYKTGDLCRYLPDGNIEFIGRTDFQVKLRGFRIELGEIEHALLSQNDVREVVVLAHSDHREDKRLVAYVVGEAKERHLRAALSQTLPDYMIPAAFVPLEAMPLTSNGKIDRRALPAPDFEVDSAQLVLPRTPHETILAAIWQDILGLKQVGIHDNFFELGGHSLLATQVVSRIRQTVQVELPLRRLFSAPTIAELAEKLTSTESALPPIEPVARPEYTGALPLSFAQQRLWFLAQFEGMSNVYNIPVALRLSGTLDVAALSASWQAICERHEVLRTTFTQVDGQPHQQINPSSGKLDFIDLSDLPFEMQDAEVARLSLKSAMQPFDLTTGPLWRVTLLRLSEKEHVLLLTMHHIISDGWSINLLMRELSALVRSATTVLPELPVQYADFALWQREWLTGAVLQGQLEYWKAQLADAPPLLTLPTDHPRPAQQSYHGDRLSFRLPDALSKELKNLSQKNGTTLFMTLQAAFALLLSRYSGQEDILIGTPIASRQVAEVEGLIGFFVNTLVLRNDLSAENGTSPTFHDLLTRVRRVALDAYQYQAVPFELLVDTLQPSRSLSHSPLFQVVFSLENNRREALSIPGITVTPLDLQYPIAKFDLTLFMEQHGEGLIASWEYNTDLFERTTIERMAGNFQTLLEGIVANPNQPIANLPLLTEAERHQLLVEWNDTATDYPSDACIHQLFEQQVARSPEAIAVVLGNQQLTYHELNARANQLAHYLIAQGVGRDVLVGICVERSIEMVVGLLGILKAGGAYLPLDPTYPPERLSFMLEDAMVSILLTQERFGASWPQVSRQLCLDQESLYENEPDSNPLTRVKPNHLAYCIYTSGSTGLPKGVLVEHRGVPNLARAQIEAFGIDSDSRVLQFASFSFDASVSEIFTTLLTGAQLVIPSPNTLLAGPSLHKLLQEQRITVVTLPPSVLSTLPPLELRTLVVAGEACPSAVAKQWLSGAIHLTPTGFRFINAYGPTEATVCATMRRLTLAQISSNSLPIGQPIANTQIYILDRHQKVVPILGAGELYIGGVGVARGYLNRPQLTSEKFIPNPFGPGRLYKTGDLCRYLPDGNIEFLGRTDYQVKIRGFRIELGEIEAALNSEPNVRETVVVAREEPSGKRLVAYVVGDAPAKGLRAALSDKLPDYMIPSVFMQIESMPQSPNGKIDRRALPAPEIEVDSAQLVLPRTPQETIVAEIWQGILGVKQVGIHDHFFEIGGHSLLATQVVSRIRQTFAVELPLRTFFEKPTVDALAAEIEHLHSDSDSEQVVMRRIPLAERTAPLPLSHAQQRLWFLDQFGSSIAYNIPLALDLRGPLNVTVLQQTLQEIVRRHESLRTTFAVDDDYPYQVVHPDMIIELPVIDLSAYGADEIEAKVKRLTYIEATDPFDLSSDAMLRATLLKLSDRENTTTSHYILLLTMHHIASDGWSMGVLVREMAALYDAFSQGKASPLPSLPIQYADFAVWQRTYLQEEVLEEQLRYWTENLADAAELLQLPTDRARPAQQSGEGAVVSLQLDAKLTKALRTLSQQQGTTLYMTLLASFQVLMGRYSGQSDIVIGSPIANRNRQELEPLIGFFVNTLALRADLAGGNLSGTDTQALSFLDLLAQAQKTTQTAYDHQDMPFERLVEELRPERNLNHNPLVQVMFALQNAPMGAFELSGLKVTPVKAEIQATRFDMEMHFWEVDDYLEGYCVYSTDLFDQATIERMTSHFETLLEGIVNNPTQSVAELPLLTEAERHQLLLEWNDTATDYPFEACIHQLFEQQVERTPDAIALVFENQQLSYRELNERANQLAHHLQSLGVGAETLVGICMPRSSLMIVGLLAILKAGGAYVPLDLTYPEERLAFMLEDTQAPVVITQQPFVHLFTRHADVGQRQTSLVVLDRWQDEIAHQPTRNPLLISTSAQPAYIIYTSGSTGIPKGVTIPHVAINRLVFNTNYIDIQATDRIAQASNASFDAATFEIWGALAHGATLVGIGRDVILDPQQLARYLREEEISVLFLTTALFNQIVLAVPNAFATLRYLLFGGEAVDPITVRMVLEEGRPTHLLHVYGPTESTTYSTWYSVQSVSKEAITVPIGGALANTQLYVLDRQLQPVPIGVAGELYIGGDGLALEYHKRPELTAERFVRNPFAPGRLYKSGDLVRWLPERSIEFLGRIDNQVKLRGFRIELGEIESALTSHSNIQEAIVLVREDGAVGNRDKQIVGYMVAGEVDSETETEHVEEWLSLYEETYGQTSQQEELAFNLLGWNSSYTGQPIPEIEMVEWVEGTIADIRRLERQRILEIGCGTGLLLSQLAPDCALYWGTDYSEQAIQHVERLKAATADLGHVVLSQRLADDFTGIAENQFDCVILNSIVQYFPSVEYLLSVLEGAVRAVTPGGKIYVGDVRNLRLLSAYHAAVQSYQAADDLPLADLREHIQQRLWDEEELLIDPDFFYALRKHLPQITQVEIAVKRGQYVNELTQFRYQVVLHIEEAESEQVDQGQIDWLEEDWQQQEYTISTLENRLHQLIQGSPEAALVVRNMPNGRVQDTIQTLEILEQINVQPLAKEMSNVEQLRAHLARQNERLYPESLSALSERFPVRILVTWSRSPGLMDAFFVPNTPLSMPHSLPQAERVKKPWRDYTNNPLLGKLNRTLVPKVRTWLAEKLPDYMIPSAFVMLDALPLTPNGKVDRKALPAPLSLVRLDDDAFVPPSTATESSLADIWSEVLGIQRLSVWDDFFEIGGHSLMATQMVSRIKSHFEINMPVRDVFENPTIAELGEHIEVLLEAKQMTQQSEQADDQLSIDEEMELEEW